ncbi:hypothetical protein Ssi03_08540 [Sphaerisporangium siamense]|nr:hypothetical protein Ssi03_08540 [Sphaerisporangium siamense]
MACVADQQQTAVLIDGQDRHRWQEQQLMADDGPKPCYVRGYTHLRDLPGPLMSRETMGVFVWLR